MVHFHTVIFEMKNTPLVPEENTGDPLSHKHAGFCCFVGVCCVVFFFRSIDADPFIFMIKTIHLLDRWPGIGHSLSS